MLEKQEVSCTAGKSGNGTAALGSNWGKSSKAEDVELLVISFLGLYPKPGEAPSVFTKRSAQEYLLQRCPQSRNTGTT